MRESAWLAEPSSLVANEMERSGGEPTARANAINAFEFSVATIWGVGMVDVVARRQ